MVGNLDVQQCYRAVPVRTVELFHIMTHNNIAADNIDHTDSKKVQSWCKLVILIFYIVLAYLKHSSQFYIVSNDNCVKISEI